MRRRDVHVCSAAVSRRLVLKRPADFPSSACFGQWGIEISHVWLLNCLQLCANLTRLVNFADKKKTYGCSEAGHGDVSTQLIQIDLLVCLSWLVYSLCLLRSWCWPIYGTWTTDMPGEQQKSAKRREDYIYIYIWTESYIIGFLYICRKPFTISPYDHTHAQPRTHVHTHTYMYTGTHNMNTAHLHHHNITYQNITWHIITSRHMQQDQYIYVCMHLHYCHLTSHRTKIISPHTHTHTYNIRMYITHITNCLLHPVHISLTHYQSDTPVHAHTYMHTNSPTITRHSHTSSSLVAFLCSV